MRLYRAMPTNETTLNSHQRALSKTKNALSDICLLDEIYSHIMPTHNLDIAHLNRVVFSFTDDIDVTYSLTEKYPATYAKIGYIDIKSPENSSALLKGDPNLLLVKPIFRLSDWVDLAIYCAGKSVHTSINVHNVNYASKGVPLINTLVPSRWGALSLAHTAREYVVICKNLVPAIMSANDIASTRADKHLKDFDLFVSDNNPSNKKKVIDCLQNDLRKIIITEVRRNYLSEKLDECA